MLEPFGFCRGDDANFGVKFFLPFCLKSQVELSDEDFCQWRDSYAFDVFRYAHSFWSPSLLPYRRRRLFKVLKPLFNRTRRWQLPISINVEVVAECTK